MHERAAIEAISFTLNMIGSVITVWGAILALIAFARKELIKQRQEAVSLNASIHLKLGSYLVLALDFFIAADIIKTIITPTWNGLGMLGTIVIIRTILSYFLTKDIKDGAKLMES